MARGKTQDRACAIEVAPWVGVQEDNQREGHVSRRSRIETGGENRGRKHLLILDGLRSLIEVGYQWVPGPCQKPLHTENYRNTKRDSAVRAESSRSAAVIPPDCCIAIQAHRTSDLHYLLQRCCLTEWKQVCRRAGRDKATRRNRSGCCDKRISARPVRTKLFRT